MIRRKNIKCLFLAIIILIISCATPAMAYYNYYPNYEGTSYIEIEVGCSQSTARSLLTLINQFRTGSEAWYWAEDNTTKVICNGLSPLVYDYELEKLAIQRAAEVAVCSGHTRPDGTSNYSILTEYNYSCTAAAENIAVVPRDFTAADVMELLKETDDTYAYQGHRRVFLSKNVTRVGIGRVNFRGTNCWVMVFSNGTGGTSGSEAYDGPYYPQIRVLNSDLSVVSVTPSVNSLSVTEGQSIALPTVSVQMTTTGYMSSYYYSDFPVRASYDWSVVNTSIARISNGKLKGIKEGNTYLKTSIYGRVVTIPISVKSGTGWQSANGKIYYINSSGVALTGWQMISGQWYYFNPSTAVLQTGWIKSGSNFIYFDVSSWSWASGWKQINGTWYYFDRNTLALLTGWVKSGSGYCYLDPNTYTWASGWKTIGGKLYYFDPGTLALRTGWIQSGKDLVYFDAKTGSWASGWTQIDGMWYYFKPSTQALQTGWIRSGSDLVYLDSKTLKWASGWTQINGTWYYFDRNTLALLTGWVKSGDSYSYLDPNTLSWASGLTTINGKLYCFNDKGSHEMETGFIGLGDEIYFFNFQTGSAVSGWQFIDDTWLYFNPATKGLQIGWVQTENGMAYFELIGWSWASGWKVIDGAMYYFDPETLVLQSN